MEFGWTQGFGNGEKGMLSDALGCVLEHEISAPMCSLPWISAERGSVRRAFVCLTWESGNANNRNHVKIHKPFLLIANFYIH